MVGTGPTSAGPFSSMSEFDIQKELYRSACSVVYLAKVTKNGPNYKGPPLGTKVVLKKRPYHPPGAVPQANCKKNILDNFDLLHEYSLLLECKDHGNIIDCLGYFMENNFLVLIIEYAEKGDLNKELKLRSKKPFSNKEIWDLFLQLLSGLRFVHSKGIVHRDVKTLNIFLTNNGYCKLGDFGVSRQLESKNVVLSSFYGTPLYLSPEIIMGTGYTAKTDIWSLGVVLYEIVSNGRMPFGGRSLKDITQSVLACKYKGLDQNRQEFMFVIELCLQKDPNRRPSADALYSMLKKFLKERNELKNQEDIYSTRRDGSSRIVGSYRPDSVLLYGRGVDPSEFVVSRREQDQRRERSKERRDSELERHQRERSKDRRDFELERGVAANLGHRAEQRARSRSARQQRELDQGHLGPRASSKEQERRSRSRDKSKANYRDRQQYRDEVRNLSKYDRHDDNIDDSKHDHTQIRDDDRSDYEDRKREEDRKRGEDRKQGDEDRKQREEDLQKRQDNDYKWRERKLESSRERRQLKEKHRRVLEEYDAWNEKRKQAPIAPPLASSENEDNSRSGNDYSRKDYGRSNSVDKLHAAGRPNRPGIQTAGGKQHFEHGGSCSSSWKPGSSRENGRREPGTKIGGFAFENRIETEIKFPMEPPHRAREKYWDLPLEEESVDRIYRKLVSRRQNAMAMRDAEYLESKGVEMQLKREDSKQEDSTSLRDDRVKDDGRKKVFARSNSIDELRAGERRGKKEQLVPTTKDHLGSTSEGIGVKREQIVRRETTPLSESMEPVRKENILPTERIQREYRDLFTLHHSEDLSNRRQYEDRRQPTIEEKRAGKPTVGEADETEHQKVIVIGKRNARPLFRDTSLPETEVDLSRSRSRSEGAGGARSRERAPDRHASRERELPSNRDHGQLATGQRVLQRQNSRERLTSKKPSIPPSWRGKENQSFFRSNIDHRRDTAHFHPTQREGVTPQKQQLRVKQISAQDEARERAKQRCFDNDSPEKRRKDGGCSSGSCSADESPPKGMKDSFANSTFADAGPPVKKPVAPPEKTKSSDDKTKLQAKAKAAKAKQVAKSRNTESNLLAEIRNVDSPPLVQNNPSTQIHHVDHPNLKRAATSAVVRGSPKAKGRRSREHGYGDQPLGEVFPPAPENVRTDEKPVQKPDVKATIDFLHNDNKGYGLELAQEMLEEEKTRLEKERENVEKEKDRLQREKEQWQSQMMEQLRKHQEAIEKLQKQKHDENERLKQKYDLKENSPGSVGSAETRLVSEYPGEAGSNPNTSVMEDGKGSLMGSPETASPDLDDNPYAKSRRGSDANDNPYLDNNKQGNDVKENPYAVHKIDLENPYLDIENSYNLRNNGPIRSGTDDATTTRPASGGHNRTRPTSSGGQDKRKRGIFESSFDTTDGTLDDDSKRTSRWYERKAKYLNHNVAIEVGYNDKEPLDHPLDKTSKSYEVISLVKKGCNIDDRYPAVGSTSFLRDCDPPKGNNTVADFIKSNFLWNGNENENCNRNPHLNSIDHHRNNPGLFGSKERKAVLYSTRNNNGNTDPNFGGSNLPAPRNYIEDIPAVQQNVMRIGKKEDEYTDDGKSRGGSIRVKRYDILNHLWT